MPVASSTYVVDAHAQHDGRSYVTETHTLTTGGQVVLRYLASAGADYAAIMAARVGQIDAHLAEAELDALLGNGS